MRLTKDKIMVRNENGKLEPQEINLGTETEPETILMTPLVYGEILELGNVHTGEATGKMPVGASSDFILKLLAKHLIEPKMSVEELKQGNHKYVNRLINEMNKISNLLNDKND